MSHIVNRSGAAAALLAAAVLLAAPSALWAEGPAPANQAPASLKYLWAKAYHVPPETTTEESGYFSLCEGKNGKIYIGTAAYGRNAYLVEFDPATEKMRIVVDAHKVADLPLEPTGYAAQSKIHTPQLRRAVRHDLLRHQAGLTHRSGEKERPDRDLSRRLRHDLRTRQRRSEKPRHAHAARLPRIAHQQQDD